MTRLPQARTERERGAVLPIVALVLGVLITFTAIAVDLGYQRVARRDMQALADVIALDAVRRLDGRDVTTLDPIVDAAAAASAARNPDGAGDTPAIDVVLGELDSNGDFVELFTTAIPTAVKVTAATSVDYFFKPGSGGASRSAVATLESLGNFMIGSYLVGADLDTSLLNRVLPRFFGSTLDNLNITAVGWQGLANASMNLAGLATQLGAGSPSQLASLGVVNARGFYLAAASVMQSQGDTVSAGIFNTVAATVDSTTTVDLGDIFVSQGGPSGEIGAGTNVSMPALFFLTSSAYAINGTNLITVPNFNAGIPGVTSSTLTLEVIEQPQYCATPNDMCRVGDSRTTAQVRVRLENSVSLNLNALLSGATLTGTLTTDTTAAGATGTLAAVRCQTVGGVPEGIDVNVSTNPITTTASQNLTLSAQVLFLVLNVASVNVNNAISIASGTGGLARFDYPNEFLPSIGSGGTQRVGSPDLGVSVSLAASGSNVTLLNGGPIPLPIVTNVINVGLSQTLTTLNTYVTNRLAKTLGVDIGGADVGAVDRACGSPYLAG